MCYQGRETMKSSLALVPCFLTSHSICIHMECKEVWSDAGVSAYRNQIIVSCISNVIYIYLKESVCAAYKCVKLLVIVC